MTYVHQYKDCKEIQKIAQCCDCMVGTTTTIMYLHQVYKILYVAGGWGTVDSVRCCSESFCDVMWETLLKDLPV